MVSGICQTDSLCLLMEPLNTSSDKLAILVCCSVLSAALEISLISIFSGNAGGGIRARQKARRCLIHSRWASVYSEYPMSINQRADALRQRFALSSRPAIASFTISGVGLLLLKT